MPVEKWLEIVKEAAELGVKEWHVAGGGDPPFFPELTFPVLTEIKKHGMLGIMTTNGTNLTQQQLLSLVAIRWDRVHFSIDGPNAKLHDHLRGCDGAFKKTISTMKLLHNIRYKSNKPEINMNTVISTENFKLLPKIVKLAKRLKVGYLFAEPLIVYSKAGEQLKLSPEQQKEFIPYLTKAISYTQKYNISSNLSQNLIPELIQNSSAMHEIVKSDMDEQNHPFLSVPCFDPWFHMTIKADGRAISCDVATDEGDSIKNKSLKEVWFGAYFEKHRKLMLSRQIPNFCRQCNPSHTTQRRNLRAEIKKNEKN
jgi:MoaA/NifB/PqqE/SkfB family radical SAM enzyme